MKRNPWIFSPVVVFLFLASVFLFSEVAKADDAPSEGYSEETTSPEMDTAVQMSQEKVQDPFAAKFQDEGPARQTFDMANAPKASVLFQGVGMGEKGAYAVINGEVFYAGEEKKGIKMVEVRKREVDIVVGGESRTVPLFPEEDLVKAQERHQAKTNTDVLSQEPTGKDPRRVPVKEPSTL